jgi:hypothetical protein
MTVLSWKLKKARLRRARLFMRKRGKVSRSPFYMDPSPVAKGRRM